MPFGPTFCCSYLFHCHVCVPVWRSAFGPRSDSVLSLVGFPATVSTMSARGPRAEGRAGTLPASLLVTASLFLTCHVFHSPPTRPSLLSLLSYYLHRTLFRSVVVRLSLFRLGSVSRLEYPRVSLCPRVSSCHALVCSSSGSYAPPISVMSRARHVSRASVFYRIVRPCRSACRALCGASRPCGAVCALRAYLLLFIFIPLSRVRSGVAFGLRASVGFGAEPSRVPGDSQHNVRPRAAGRGPRRNATRFASRHSFAVPHVPCLSFQPPR